MKKIGFGLLPVLLALVICSCGTGKGIKDAKALGSCKFSFRTVDSVYLAGIDIREFRNVRSFSDLDLMRYPALGMGLLRKEIPLDLRVVLEISNPSKRDAAVEDVEYKILLGQSEFFAGKLNRNIRVPAGAESVLLPVRLRTNAFQLLNNDVSRNDLISLLQSLYGSAGQPSRLTIKLKPTVAQGKKTMVYPGYLTIEKDLTPDLINKSIN